jgi:hypothetical protein
MNFELRLDQNLLQSDLKESKEEKMQRRVKEKRKKRI